MRKLQMFLKAIKFEHTIFALPFAYVGMILGAQMILDRWPLWTEVLWITIAMVGARTAAMGLNRMIDRTIDARNPRTSSRALASGKLSARDTIIFVLISLLLLAVAATQLHPAAVQWMPLAVFMLVVYSYTKRFTWVCHLVLGLTIGLAPLGGWLALTGEFGLVSIVLYLSVAVWIAGFDIVYALQDETFDREHHLHSIPARFGAVNSLWLARGLHLMTSIGFILLFLLTPLSWIFLFGIGIAFSLLIYQHLLVKARDLSQVQTAFFTMNGTLSVVVFLFVILDFIVL